MAKQQTESKSEGPSAEQQLEALRKSIADQSAVLIDAAIGKDDPIIAPGHPFWSQSLEEVRSLYQNYSRSAHAAADLLEKSEKYAAELIELRGQKKTQITGVAELRPEPGFIILPDGQRINTRVIASYHATGIGEIEFKTSDGKVLGVYSAPLNTEQGSILPARRKEIRDKVIAQLDKLVDAMD